MNKYKDKNILDIITNDLKLDLKESQTENIRPIYPLSSKEDEIISIKIIKLLRKVNYSLEYARWRWIYFWNFY